MVVKDCVTSATMQHIIKNLNYGEVTAVRRLERSLQEHRNFTFTMLALWCVCLCWGKIQRGLFLLQMNQTWLADNVQLI